jgi:hypothetical protein
VGVKVRNLHQAIKVLEVIVPVNKECRYCVDPLNVKSKVEELKVGKEAPTGRALNPFPLKSLHTVPLPGYDFGLAASRYRTSPSLTMLVL